MTAFNVNDQFKVLLRDYGYRTGTDEGKIILIASGVRGFFPSTTVPVRFGTVMAAVEYLIPRLRNEEFSARYRKIVG
jgi:hypothetical protein